MMLHEVEIQNKEYFSGVLQCNTGVDVLGCVPPQRLKMFRRDTQKTVAAAYISSYGLCGFTLLPVLILSLSLFLSPSVSVLALFYLLSITCITAAAQNRWRNNVFKGIMLQLMASLGESLQSFSRAGGRPAQFPARRDLK